MNFIGERCPVCNNRFTADDDVVVCPECGAPHHRECYKIENKCAYNEYHSTGYKWERSAAAEEKISQVEVTSSCPECGTLNRETDEICTRCGSRLHTDAHGEFHSQQEQRSSQGAYQDVFRGAETANGQETMFSFLGFDPNEDMGGATLTEVSGFVKTNILYYLPIFKRMKDLGTKISFNLTCLIFPNLYFANRKMWLWAIIATILEVICSLPSLIVVMADMSSNGAFAIPGADVLAEFVSNHENDLFFFNEVFSMAFWVVKIVCCLFGNWLYYRFTLSSLKKLREQSPDRVVAPGVILAKGGTKPANMILVLAVTGIISSAAIALFAAYPSLLEIFII
ncbi:MAG: hypothetical protein IKK47_00910 [Ruminococcus sp.]|nr:hypothetical protein [Ruminococcus sp.]